MKTLLTFILFSIQLGVLAQIPDNPNFTDSNGLRQGKWTMLVYDKDWSLIEDRSIAQYYRLIEYKDERPIGIVRPSINPW